jgi:hypothetical protein
MSDTGSTDQNVIHADHLVNGIDLKAELLGGYQYLDDRHRLLLVAAMHRLFVDQKKETRS